MNQSPTIDRIPFYEHKGYLLTALWQNQANVRKLSEATGIDQEVIADAVRSFEIDIVDLASMWSESDDVEMQDFLSRAGLTQDVLMELQPIPGVNLDEINAEMAAEIHAKTTRCPLCQSGLKHTLKSHPSGDFRMHVYQCGTTLDFEGMLPESRKCSRIQDRQAVNG